MQPGGSVKDRAAYQIIKDAYERGDLKKGQPVVEMTSGNMGAGMAIVCKQLGNPFIAVMSEGNSVERRKVLKALGAEVIHRERGHLYWHFAIFKREKSSHKMRRRGTRERGHPEDRCN